MSHSDRTVADIRQAFVRGDLTADELREELAALGQQGDRDALWARWADQGLFDRPIAQEGFTSTRGRGRETVTPDLPEE